MVEVAIFIFIRRNSPLVRESDSWSLYLIEPLIVLDNSYSMGFAFSLPRKTFMFSKLDITIISLDLLAFAFCLLVDGIKIMRESTIELFFYIDDCNIFNINNSLSKNHCVRDPLRSHSYTPRRMTFRIGRVMLLKITEFYLKIDTPL